MNIYVVINIVVVILILCMIRQLILNYKIRILNDRCNKLFHHFTVPILTCCKQNKFGLKIGQVFKRYYDPDENYGYKIISTELTLIGKMELRNSGENAILKRLYFLPTDTLMKEYIYKEVDITDDNLMANDTLYLEYNENIHLVEVWCGKYRLEELEGSNSIRVISGINKILNHLYKECKMRGKSVGPLIADFLDYFKFRQGETHD